MYVHRYLCLFMWIYLFLKFRTDEKTVKNDRTCHPSWMVNIGKYRINGKGNPLCKIGKNRGMRLGRKKWHKKKALNCLHLWIKERRIAIGMWQYLLDASFIFSQILCTGLNFQHSHSAMPDRNCIPSELILFRTFVEYFFPGWTIWDLLLKMEISTILGGFMPLSQKFWRGFVPPVLPSN